MGWRFRKIFQSGPFRWTWTKKGVGWSIGVPGLRYGVSPNGSRYVSFGIPGTGLYFIKYLDKNKPSSQIPSQSQPPGQLPTTPTTKTAPPNAEPWWKQKTLSNTRKS